MFKIYRISQGRSVLVGEFNDKTSAEQELAKLRTIDPDNYYTM